MNENATWVFLESGNREMKNNQRNVPRVMSPVKPNITAGFLGKTCKKLRRAIRENSRNVPALKKN